MKYIKIITLILFLALQLGSFGQCPGGITSALVNPFINNNPSSCSFSIGGTAVDTNPPWECAYSAECGTSYFYLWRLYYKAPSDPNFSHVSNACNNNSTHSFVVSATGQYKVMVIYKSLHPDCPCLVRVDEYVFTVNNNVCPYIGLMHSGSSSATVKRSFPIEVDCAVADNKSTILMSEQSVHLLSGFSSGTGTSTYFHAYVDACSSTAYRTSDSSNQDFALNVIENTRKSNNGFSVFPNPTNGSINISVPQAEDANIKIYNVLGEVVYDNIMNGTRMEISLPEAPGVYHIEVSYGNRLFYRKVVKQ